MKRSATVLFLLCAAVACALSAPEEVVGTKGVVNEKAINYIKDIAIPIVEMIVLGTTIPDVNGSVKTPVGHVDYKLSSVKIPKFVVAHTAIDFVAPDTITATIGELDAEVVLHWHYREHKWPHIADSGTADAKTERAHATLSFKVGRDATDRPTAHISACNVNLNKLHIKLHGGASWLYQIFVDVFHKLIVSQVDKAICTALKTKIDPMITATLAGVPMHEPIGAGMAISYELTDAPKMVRDSLGHRLVVSTAGEMYAINEGPGHTPVLRVPMPDGETDEMFEVLLSSYTLESMGYAAVHAGALKTRLTKNMVPAQAATFFSTFFYKQYAPGVYTKYGKVDVALDVSVDIEPIVVIDQTGLTATIPVTIAVNPQINGGAAYERAFAIMCVVTCDAEIGINGTNLIGALQIDNVTTTLLDSSVGNVDLNGMGDLITFALSMGLDVVNGYLDDGFPLPAVEGITIVKPRILWRRGYLVVASDFKYEVPTRVLRVAGL